MSRNSHSRKAVRARNGQLPNTDSSSGNDSGGATMAARRQFLQRAPGARAIKGRGQICIGFERIAHAVTSTAYLAVVTRDNHD